MRHIMATFPASFSYGATFAITTTVRIRGVVQLQLLAPGFQTHGQGMGQRMVELTGAAVANSVPWNVVGPPNVTVIPPGIYMLFMVQAGIPSAEQWVKLV